MPDDVMQRQVRVLVLDSDIEELPRLGGFLDEFCMAEGIPEQTCCHLQIAMEELFVNTINYGRCEPKCGAIRLAIERQGEVVSVEFSDSGIAFNPLEAPEPDLTRSIVDRPLGGLGIHIVRHLMSSVRYERRGARNYVLITNPVGSEPHELST